MEKEVKKAKVFHYTAFGIVLLLLLATLGLILFMMTRPLCSSVTVSGLQAETSSASTSILVKIQDAYYETAPSRDFSDIFSFDSWKHVSRAPEGEILLSLCFGELYVLDIYDSGYAAAYDGYAPMKTVSYAYYAIPEETANSLVAYFRQYGIPHTLDDGTIGAATFNH